MKNGIHRTLWRNDFSAVPPAERRVARYALQLLQSDLSRYLNLADGEVLAALWQLTLPLIDAGKFADLLRRAEAAEARRAKKRRGGETSLEDLFDSQRAELQWDDLLNGADMEAGDLPDVLRKPIRALFDSLPDVLLTRLAVADGTDPVTPAVAALGLALGLSTTEVQILDYVEHRGLNAPLRQLLRSGRHGPRGSRNPARINRERLAALLGVSLRDLHAVLARGGSLRSLSLVQCDDDDSDLEDFLTPTDLLRDVLDAAPDSAEDLLDLLIEPAPEAVWRVEAFPQLADTARRIHPGADIRRERAKRNWSARSAWLQDCGSIRSEPPMRITTV